MQQLSDHSTDRFDVIIVGAGISGIGAACHLNEKCPNKSYAILESRERIGGTWDLFRYPGIRSDSDMYTLGYQFKPWLKGKVLAEGSLIRDYVEETALENEVTPHIRFGHKVLSAAWSSQRSCWTIEVLQTQTGEVIALECNILLMCAGYYRYSEGYTPAFEGSERFKGEIIHPQKWPEGLDYSDKRVVVIGSGATAVTLIPAMADKVQHIVMLQRSPSYIRATPEIDQMANFLLRWLPAKLAYRLIRMRNLYYMGKFYKMARSNPEEVKTALIDEIRTELGEGYDVDTHFTPSYNPWDQRVCLVPGSDLFKAIKSGKASVTTDHIDSFTEKGILLRSGKTLEADMIVTATGLNMRFMGGIDFTVDNQPINFNEKYTYLGLMISDLPNMVNTFGYINASWTLRSDLTAEFICRLINHMDQAGVSQCWPTLRPKDQGMEPKPYIVDFSSGYMQRGLSGWPKQGDQIPWVNKQDYQWEKKFFKTYPIDDGVLSFRNRRKEAASLEVAAGEI